jgi:hypothetical protein
MREMAAEPQPIERAERSIHLKTEVRVRHTAATPKEARLAHSHEPRMILNLAVFRYGPRS